MLEDHLSTVSARFNTLPQAAQVHIRLLYNARFGHLSQYDQNKANQLIQREVTDWVNNPKSAPALIDVVPYDPDAMPRK